MSKRKIEVRMILKDESPDQQYAIEIILDGRHPADVLPVLSRGMLEKVYEHWPDLKSDELVIDLPVTAGGIFNPD